MIIHDIIIDSVPAKNINKQHPLQVMQRVLILCGVFRIKQLFTACTEATGSRRAENCPQPLRKN